MTDMDAATAGAGGASGRSRGALHGIRVLDLSTGIAGPMAGMYLADFGADVVKVEPPEGDSWRDRGMAYIRGQRGLAINLRATEGRDAFYRLARTADVVLDNYRAGVLGRLGIGYEELARVNPGIVTVSITAFGEESPYAGEPAFDPLLQARSGMMTALGGDSEPVLLTVAVNDVITASLAALGAVTAVFRRRATGEGQRVTVTLAGTATIAQSGALIEAKDRMPPVTGGRDFRGPSAFDRAYATSDGWVRLQAPDDAAPALRRAGLVAGPGPATEQEWVAALSAGFAALTASAAVQALSREGTPAVPVRKASELPDDADYRKWGIFQAPDSSTATCVRGPDRAPVLCRVPVKNQGAAAP